MVLEHLFPEDWLKKKSRYAFLLGIGYSILGIINWGGDVVYQKIKGFIAFPELFLWGNSVVSFYLGSTVMKR